jgi:GntR family transcriptional regulator, trigonelline degradation regulator
MLEILERPKTLKQSALERLREAIMLGAFKPGERLIERILCEQLNVSRTVIRECIRHLESERLITTIANAGPSVSILDAAQVSEIYEIRSTLESAAAQACAKNADEKTIKQLKKYCTTIETDLKAGKILEALDQTKLFYQTIFHSGNKAVSWDLVEQLNGRIGRLRVLTLKTKGRATTGPENLKNIIAGIEDRAPATAAKACQKHMKEPRSIALECLASLDN